MKKYKMKRKFHRLKNGDFIDLSKNDTLEVLQKLSEGTNIDFKNLGSLSIIKNSSLKEIFNDLFSLLYFFRFFV